MACDRSGVQPSIQADTCTELVIPPAMAGCRLDHALKELLPDLGLRGRRRFLAEGRALVNGEVRHAAYHLHHGDRITIFPAKEIQNIQETTAPPYMMPSLAPYLVLRQSGYGFFYKPSGLHTVALAGGGGASLEAAIVSLLGDAPELAAACRLLQRLDYTTSGLVCAAFNPEAEAAFRAAEAKGLCEKRYVALLEGQMCAPRTAKFVLKTDNRTRSRVLAQQVNSERWTEFFPLYVWPLQQETPPLFVSRLLEHAGCVIPMPPQGLTLAACRIRRGARHQIRAHAAALGYPLWGDARYGGERWQGTGDNVFFLHHGAMYFSDIWSMVQPPWFLPTALSARVARWLRAGET